ncbi:MAG: zinc ribbon domain-containing protein [Coriobacteriales bacterium]|nr:zinc ribbon domain-containing protein [Coriobacteriales bacterium]
MAYCVKCGAELEPDMQFCARCGKPVKEATQPIPRDTSKETTPPAQRDAAKEAIPAIQRDVVIPRMKFFTEPPRPSVSKQQPVVQDAVITVNSDNNTAANANAGTDAGTDANTEAAPMNKLPVIPIILGVALALVLTAFFVVYILPLFSGRYSNPDVALKNKAVTSIDAASNRDDAEFDPLFRKEFVWYTANMYNGIAPSYITTQTGLEDVVGQWKAYLLTDPTGQFNSRSERSFDVLIDGATSGKTKLTFNWDYVYVTSTGKGHPENTPNYVYNGNWSNGTIDASGYGRVSLTAFWAQDNKQYAIGIMTWPEGVPASIALVRDVMSGQVE